MHSSSLRVQVNDICGGAEGADGGGGICEEGGEAIYVGRRRMGVGVGDTSEGE